MTEACARQSTSAPRVCFIIAHLGLGGAQRALVDMVNRWAASGAIQPSILVLDADSAPACPLAPAVPVRWLRQARRSSSLHAKIANNVHRVRSIRDALRESSPDVVVAFQDTTNVLALLAVLGTGIPVVVSERTDPAFHHIGTFWSVLRALAYPLAAVVVVQTATARKGLPWPSRRNSEVIPNAVFAPKGEPGLAMPLPRPLVLGIGRFSEEKGFLDLLRAFGLAAATRPGWHLALLGDGPQRTALATLAQALSLSDRVHLPGAVYNIDAWLGEADVFALASHYEGFPNALCEALAKGLPAIATATSGSAAVIRPEVDGLLVPVKDIVAFSVALGRLMDDEALRRNMALRARDILTRFEADQVLGLWEELLRKVTTARHSGTLK